MPLFRRVELILLCVLLSSFITYRVVSAHRQDRQPDTRLIDAAHEIHAKETPAATTQPEKAPLPSPAAASSAIVADPPEIADFMQKVTFQVYRKDFAQLDQIADDVRSTHARFPGGGWKLRSFYVEMSAVNGGSEATEADWQQHLGFFQQWISSRPQSITARVALADAYLSYAWEARGTGYADQVTPQGWRLFNERVSKAADVLVEAAKLDAKCPQWYLEAEDVARAQGLNAEQLGQILDEAAADYPDYYYIYQEHAVALLPKWAGRPGDTEAFAGKMYRRIGGQNGALVYFQIAADLCQECSEFNADLFSWEKLQEGFAALEQRYGLTPYWLNTFARMAVDYEDKTNAAKAFARIGDHWDESVWGSREKFDAHRAWAGLPPLQAPVNHPAFVMDTGATQRLNQLLTDATTASQQSRWNDAARDLHEIITVASQYPETDYWLMRAYQMLAINERNQGHMEAAKSIFGEEIQALNDKTGPDSHDIGIALSARAMLEQQMKDDKGAEADLVRAMAIFGRAKGESMELPMAAYALSLVYRRHSRYEDAVGLLKPIVGNEPNADPQQEKRNLWVVEALAMTYQDMGKLTQSEAAYRRFLRTADVTLPVNSIGFVEPLSKMASLYHAMGKDEEARKIEQRLEQIRQSSAQQQ